MSFPNISQLFIIFHRIDKKPLKRTRKKRTKRARPTKEQMAEEIKKVKQEMEEEINPMPPPDENADPIDLDPTIQNTNHLPKVTIPLVRLDPSVTYHAANTYMTSPRKPVSELRLMSLDEEHIKLEEVKEEPTTPTENRPSTSFFNDSSLMLCETPSKIRRSQSALVPVVPRATTTQNKFLAKVKRESGARELDYARCWVEPWLNFQREVESFGFSQSVTAKVLEQNVEECERALLRITEKNRRNLPENIKTKAKLKL